MNQSMKRLVGLLAAAALIGAAGGGAWAAGSQGTPDKTVPDSDYLAYSGYPGYMGGPGMMGSWGPGMMGPGMMGGSVGDAQDWLAGVKQDLGIKPNQEDAWKAYRQAVINRFALMNAHHQAMWGTGTPPGGQTWGQMREQGWQSMQQMTQAADDLYQTLTPEQQSKANGLLMYRRGWFR